MPTYTIADVIKQLETRQAKDSKGETESLISTILVSLREISTSEAANLLRKDVNQLRMRSDLNSDTKKLLHQVALAIAHDYPINTECPIAQEPIKEGKAVFISTGHQFDIDNIFTWISTNRRPTNPLTGDLLAPEDIEYICGEKGYSLTTLQTMASRSSNDNDPQGLNHDAIQRVLDRNQGSLLTRDAALIILANIQPEFMKVLLHAGVVAIDALPRLRQQHYQALQQHQTQLLNFQLSFQQVITLSNKPPFIRDLVSADILPMLIVDNGLSALQMRAFEQYLPQLLSCELSLEQATTKMAKQEAFNAMTPEQQLEVKKQEGLEAKRKEEQKKVQEQYRDLYNNRPPFMATVHGDWGVPLASVLALNELQLHFLEKNGRIMGHLFKFAELRLEQALKLTEKELELFKKTPIRELAYSKILFLGSKTDLDAEQLQAYDRGEILLLKELSNLSQEKFQALIDNRLKLAEKEISLLQVIGERNEINEPGENKLEQPPHHENVTSTLLRVHGSFSLQTTQSQLPPRPRELPPSTELVQQASEKENTVNSNGA